ncbi:MAG: hypothetical protein PHQ96_04075 [Candidatus Omnitrophica bacterium]|nr:hypothetical protein [Candidatus Omnitrophota bacterium]
MKAKEKLLRKANVILEYSMIIVIVISAVYGVYYFLKRSIQGKLKDESDQYIGHGQGLEWETNTLTITGVNSDYRRVETEGGGIAVNTEFEASHVALTAPVPSFRGYGPMMHKQAGVHVQDAVMPAPTPQNPEEQNEPNEATNEPEEGP